MVVYGTNQVYSQISIYRKVMFMRKICRNTLGLALGLLMAAQAAWAAEPEPGVQILKLDRAAQPVQLPDNFRTAQSPYKKSADDKYPSREGLDNLRQSGSSFFSKPEFRELLKKVPAGDLVVIDLRNESHGYVNDEGISWYSRYKTFNFGQSAAEIDRREKSMLETLRMNGRADISLLGKDKSITGQKAEAVNAVQTEEAFVKSQGVKYYRVPVMDYSAPTPKNVDDFLQIYKHLPANAWVHVHCEAGVGRTTIFLSMMDMIKNAGRLSYDEIMTREVLLGGQDVRTSAETTKDEYKKAHYPERAEFTRRFYEYARENPDLKVSYTQWTAEHGYRY